MLARLPIADDPRVLVGFGGSDDAAVVRLSDDLALIETVDVFPPIVDDAYDFGRIAATNALSDIYAIGAEPLNALRFVAWPMDALGPEPLSRVFAGAASACTDAGIAISGGHSIVDEKPKFGLFVTGTAHPDRIVSNAGARAGDVLVLTKKIRTGVLTTAVKRGHLGPEGLIEAVLSMGTLNRAAAAAMVAAGASAATDVTGFGLLGHLGNLLRASSHSAGAALGARLEYGAVPVFDGVAEMADAGLCPGGIRRNLDYAAPQVEFSSALSEAQCLLLADAQTSGGLLIAIEPARFDVLLASLEDRGVEVRAVIGEIENGDSVGRVRVV